MAAKYGPGDKEEQLYVKRQELKSEPLPKAYI